MSRTDDNPSHYEIVLGDSEEDNGFAELWDQSLAPDGLAFEFIMGKNGDIAVIGHGVHVPLEEVEKFLAKARAYFSTGS